MSPGDIALVWFPFGGAPGAKLRPSLLVTGPVGPVPEVLGAYVASVIPSVAMPRDIEMVPRSPDFVTTGLKTRSVIRLREFATVHQRNVVRFLGRASPATMAEVGRRLRALLNI